MEKLFKQHFWVVKLLGVAGATALAASAITTQLGASLLFAAEDGDDEEAKEEDEADEEDNPLKKGNPFARSSGVANRQSLAKNITDRNIFCPTCAPVTDQPTAQLYDELGRPIGPVIRPGEVKTSLPLKLMATMESSDPKFSFATIYDDDIGGAGLYSIDEVIRPGVLLTGIDRGLVHIRNGAALEYIEISAELEKKAKSGAKDKDKNKKPTKPNQREIPGATDSINCPSEALCLVERAFVEKLMANPALLAKQARVVPSVKDGETVGFKFYGIRRGSLPKLLGLKNGDLLTHVNGEELTSMDKAMGLYTKLRRASNLSVTLQRKGKTMNKEIQIK